MYKAAFVTVKLISIQILFLSKLELCMMFMCANAHSIVLCAKNFLCSERTFRTQILYIIAAHNEVGLFGVKLNLITPKK